MKHLLALTLALCLAAGSTALGQGFSGFPANTTPADADLAIIEDDPAGTPATQKITLATLKTYFQGGLEIGADVQAWDADLDTWATLTPSANAQSLVEAANYAAMKALLDLEIGTDVQAFNAYLADIAGVTGAQGNILYFNGTDWVVLAPGTNGYVLTTGGAGANPSWAAQSGGGDMSASTYDPATVAEQLVGLTATQTLTNKTLTAPTITGANHLFAASAMGALAIDVTEMKNTKSISGAATMTFSATPSTGQIFGATVKNTAITDSVLTIPSSYSEAYNGARTTVTIPASGQVTLTWWYDGSQYNLYGDPVDFYADIAEDLTPTDTNVDSVAYYDAATNAVKRIPIDDLLALGSAAASGVSVVTTNFAGNFANNASHDTAQELFDIIDDLSLGAFDATAVDAVTWSDGLNASNIWTFDVSGTDTTVTWGSDIATFSGVIAADSLVMAEAASGADPGAGFGRFWVANTTPSSPRFTNDAAGIRGLLTATSAPPQDEIVIGGSGSVYNTTTSSAKFSTTGTLTLATINNSANTMQVNTEAYGTGTTVAAADCYGSVIYVTGAATEIQLPPVVAGMSLTIIADAAITLQVAPDASGTPDTIRLDGVDLTAGNELDSSGTIGDIVVLTYHSADKWYAATGGGTWADGGAAD